MSGSYLPVGSLARLHIPEIIKIVANEEITDVVVKVCDHKELNVNQKMGNSLCMVYKKDESLFTNVWPLSWRVMINETFYIYVPTHMLTEVSDIEAVVFMSNV